MPVEELSQQEKRKQIENSLRVLRSLSIGADESIDNPVELVESILTLVDAGKMPIDEGYEGASKLLGRMLREALEHTPTYQTGYQGSIQVSHLPPSGPSRL